jgi:O-succinylbenzoate synthase
LVSEDHHACTDAYAGCRERTQNTGASRGALIPTPNFNASSDDAAKPKTAAQLEREEWAKRNNAHATVTSEGAFGVSSAPKQYPSKLGFNKTNPLPQN